MTLNTRAKINAFWSITRKVGFEGYCSLSDKGRITHEGLKWQWERFLSASEKIYRFWGIPTGIKFVIFEIQNFKFYLLRQFSIFLTGPVLNERYLNFAHTIRTTFQDFAQRVGEFPKHPTGVTFLTQILKIVCAKITYISFRHFVRQKILRNDGGDRIWNFEFRK